MIVTIIIWRRGGQCRDESITESKKRKRRTQRVSERMDLAHKEMASLNEMGGNVAHDDVRRVLKECFPATIIKSKYEIFNGC
mmetsp:Transcript_10593/g.13071  ORF Transcript_10593/g.13071 Transcript_10593/m.13071 type:complete len:82 (-) Transcript_10593:17-262(-)